MPPLLGAVAVKAKASPPATQDLIERDFIYCGRRSLTSGKTGYALQPLEQKGDVTAFFGDEMVFELRRGPRRIIGGIYTGAKFGVTQAAGIDAARFSRMWVDPEDRLTWTAKDEAVEAELKEEKMRKDLTRMNEIEKIMEPLRALYQKHYESGDTGAARALRISVELALLRRGAAQ